MIIHRNDSDRFSALKRVPVKRFKQRGVIISPRRVELATELLFKRMLSKVRLAMIARLVPMVPLWVSQQNRTDSAEDVMQYVLSVSADIDKIVKDSEPYLNAVITETDEYTSEQLSFYGDSIPALKYSETTRGFSGGDLWKATVAVALIELFRTTVSRVGRDVLVGISMGKSPNEITRMITAPQTIDGEKTRWSKAAGYATRMADSYVVSLAAKMNQAKQVAAGVAKYTWRAVMDKRTRRSHAALDGKVFSWDKPPSIGHPSTAEGCRCMAEPYSEVDIPEDNFDEYKTVSRLLRKNK